MEQKKGRRIQGLLNEGTTWSFMIKTFLFIFILNLLIRLPLYFSKNFWFDGDEAIIGIMAQDFLNTGKLPFFFYGQQYGFASVETFFSALFIKIIGSKIIALKLAGMVIHTLAMCFIALTLRAKKASNRLWLFVVLVVLFFPPFYLWASQMRTTSFLLAALIFFITETKTFSWLTFILVFILSFLLLEAQAMFFLFAMVLVGNWIWKEKNKFLSLALFVFGQIGLVFLINFYLVNVGPAHSVRLIIGAEQWSQLGQQLTGFRSGFTGFHYFTIDLDMPYWFSFIAPFLIGSFTGLVVAMLVKYFRDNKIIVLFYLLALIGFLVFLSFFKEYGPRYWINFFGGTLLVILTLIINSDFSLKLTSKMFIPLILFIAICFAAPQMRVHFSENKISEKAAFAQLNHEVRNSGQKAVFTTDVYLQWQWNFLNGKDIPCCAFIEKERTQLFSRRVFDVYRINPNQVGLIGLWGIFWEMDYIDGFNENRYQVGEKYYFMKKIENEYFSRGIEVVSD